MQKKKVGPDAGAASDPAAGSEAEGGRLGDIEGARELLVRAHEGDESVLPVLRELLDAVPTLARRFVDPAREAERIMLRNYAGENLMLKEAMPRTLKLMREELAGEDPSPLERMLVERMVATWFQLQYFEALYAQHIRDLTIAQAEHQQKRIDRAHKRHLSAVKTLAQVRKMGPAIQINIADKQINTAGGT
ncbi:MAG: hypothetical protein ACRDTR_24055 [Rubrobacter sp.]